MVKTNLTNKYNNKRQGQKITVYKLVSLGYLVANELSKQLVHV